MPLARLRHLLLRRPSGRDLLDLAAAAAVFSLCAGFIGQDLLQFGWAPLGSLALMIMVALLTPAVAEEVVFRGLLIPDPPRPHIWAGVVASTALFVAWHGVEALTFLPGARALFLRADFLALAAILGLLCAALRLRSGSLWTPILLHWMVVVVWKAAMGGPDLAALTRATG